jgi:hypothetical protein
LQRSYVSWIIVPYWNLPAAERRKAMTIQANKTIQLTKEEIELVIRGLRILREFFTDRKHDQEFVQTDALIKKMTEQPIIRRSDRETKLMP